MSVPSFWTTSSMRVGVVFTKSPAPCGAESQGSRKDVRSMRPFYGVAIRVAARCRIHMVVHAATSAVPKSNKRYAIHDGW